VAVLRASVVPPAGRWDPPSSGSQASTCSTHNRVKSDNRPGPVWTVSGPIRVHDSRATNVFSLSRPTTPNHWRIGQKQRQSDLLATAGQRRRG